jgi:hypothetical protein
MTFALECPVPRRPELICPECGIIFGATSFDGKKPITCWLVRFGSDLSGIKGVRKIA